MQKRVGFVFICCVVLLAWMGRAHAGGGGGGPPYKSCVMDGTNADYCRFSDYTTNDYIAAVNALKAKFCATSVPNPSSACTNAEADCEKDLEASVQANCNQQFNDLDSNGKVTSQYYACKGDAYNLFFRPGGKYDSQFKEGNIKTACSAPAVTAADTPPAANTGDSKASTTNPPASNDLPKVGGPGCSLAPGASASVPVDGIVGLLVASFPVLRSRLRRKH